MHRAARAGIPARAEKYLGKISLNSVNVDWGKKDVSGARETKPAQPAAT